jgi:hypothetical protein
MKELDFDELDRAVNTLMGDAPKTAPALSDKTDTLTINTTLSEGEVPSFDVLNQKLSSVAAEVSSAPMSRPVASQPLATRRRGQFMDMINPAAVKPRPVPTRPTSRQGVTIAPAAPASTSISVPASNAAVLEDLSAPTPSEKIADVLDAQNAWPDPLEMSTPQAEQSSNDTNEGVVAVAPVSANSPEDAAPVAAVAEVADLPPLTSPFLSDAKVEKRPLGGGPAPETADEPDHTPVLGALAGETLTVDDATSQLPATPADVAPPLPEELGRDLMALESDDTAPRAVTAPAETQPAVQKIAVAEAAPVVTAPQQVSPVRQGAGSIPQQYREEPTTSDQTNGGIYDTSAYHQPLAHPVKSKSGWWWIVWIIALLLAGAGTGAALYFFNVI